MAFVIVSLGFPGYKSLSSCAQNTAVREHCVENIQIARIQRRREHVTIRHMAVETTTDRLRSSVQPDVMSTSPKNGLLPGERVVSKLESNDDGNFTLTHARVIFRGGSDSNSVYASAYLKDISSVEISRRPRARRSAAWGTVGLFAAIGVWQVIPSSNVGVFAAIAVAVVSMILMGDYWIRPTGVHVEFHTTGGSNIGGEIGGKSELGIQFTRDVEDAKRRLVPIRTKSPYRNYPSS